MMSDARRCWHFFLKILPHLDLRGIISNKFLLLCPFGVFSTTTTFCQLCHLRRIWTILSIFFWQFSFFIRFFGGHFLTHFPSFPFFFWVPIGITLAQFWQLLRISPGTRISSPNHWQYRIALLNGSSKTHKRSPWVGGWRDPPPPVLNPFTTKLCNFSGLMAPAFTVRWPVPRSTLPGIVTSWWAAPPWTWPRGWWATASQSRWGAVC